MKPTLKFCGEQITRFDGMTGYVSMGAAGYRERAEALRDEAETEGIAKAAMDALIGDTCRASNPDLNKLPTAGEIRVWVRAEAERRHEAEPSAKYAGGCCGRFFPGWTYLGYDPRIVVDPDNPKDSDCAKVLIPSRCENGRVLRTLWVAIRGLVQEDGRPYMQPYDYSGKCKCQSGGTL